MLDLLLGGNAVWFGVPALLGTLFFAGRVVMMLLGGGELHADAGGGDLGGGDLGGGDLGGVDSGGADLHHADSSESFKILSIQAIAAFLMGFGWTGLGVVRGWALPAIVGAGAGFVGGGAMMWILGRMLRWIARLQSSGTLPFEAALYEEGVVYVTVPAGRQGRGTVRVVVNERMQFYPAVTERAALATGTPVRITAVNEDHTLTVERVTPELPAAGEAT
jgi:hypothetical protein